MERGYGIAVPWSEDADFDLIAYRGEELHRVQAKYTASNGRVVFVRCRSASLTNGKVRRIKKYTARTIDWIAVYDRTSEGCYYVPASELGEGMELISLRLVPTRNGQRIGVRFAEDYKVFGPETDVSAGQLNMEPAGFEPATSSVQTTRSAN